MRADMMSMECQTDDKSSVHFMLTDASSRVSEKSRTADIPGKAGHEVW
jgi:hypothetical protein